MKMLTLIVASALLLIGPPAAIADSSRHTEEAGRSGNVPGGDNRDDLRSGRTDQVGDGNSGLGDDLHGRENGDREQRSRQGSGSTGFTRRGGGNSGQGDGCRTDGPRREMNSMPRRQENTEGRARTAQMPRREEGNRRQFQGPPQRQGENRHHEGNQAGNQAGNRSEGTRRGESARGGRTHDDNGHGNDVGGFDSSNPGRSTGAPGRGSASHGGGGGNSSSRGNSGRGGGRGRG